MMARALGLLAVTSVYAFTHDESAACYASRYPDEAVKDCLPKDYPFALQNDTLPALREMMDKASQDFK